MFKAIVCNPVASSTFTQNIFFQNWILACANPAYFSEYVGDVQSRILKTSNGVI